MEKNALWLFVRRLNPESALFYLLLLFLPTQLGKHFWPNFSYILGIRSDYLSPTLYFTDVLEILLFVFLSIKKFSSDQNINFIKDKIDKNKYKYSIVVLSFIIAIIIWPGNKLLELYGLAKLTEIVWWGWYVSKNLGQKYNFITVTFVFSLATIIEGILAILQFIYQHSMDGWWYWLGERHFTQQTIDIANMSLKGMLVLRPYGTFSHPNVLAGYLLIVSTLFLFLFFQLKKRLKFYFLIIYLLSSLVLFLSYGRAAIIGWIVVLVFFVYQNLKNNKIIFGLFLFAVVFLISIAFLFTGETWRFITLTWTSQTVSDRISLLSASFYLFSKYPLFGVGWYNFLPSLATLSNYQINFFSLQPVHNIFVLVLVETGMFGFIWFAFFVYKTIRKVSRSLKKNKYSVLSLVIIIEVFWTGSIDHYWLTLQQGQLLAAFIFGLIWSKYTR